MLNGLGFAICELFLSEHFTLRKHKNTKHENYFSFRPQNKQKRNSFCTYSYMYITSCDFHFDASVLFPDTLYQQGPNPNFFLNSR